MELLELALNVCTVIGIFLILFGVVVAGLVVADYRNAQGVKRTFKGDDRK